MFPIHEPINVEMYSDDTHDLAFEVFDDFNLTDKLRREWDDFIEEIGGEIFLTYDWCRIWWKYYGAKRELAIFVFREGSKICGIFPLFRERIWIGPSAITVVRIVASDYMPVAFTVPIKRQFIDSVIDTLIKAVQAHWGKWHLFHMCICGRYDALNKLVNAFRNRLGRQYQCELKKSDSQTYFTVYKDWESQIAALGSKQRTNVRRTFRETSSKNIEICSHIASEETLAQMFENFVQMHQKHWRGIGKAGHFGAWPFSKEFHREIAEIQLKLNRLRLIETKFNDSPVGYEYLYRFDNAYCWFLNARSDFEDNARIDYKWIAFRAKIECALKDGVKTIDGMRGMYDYKILMGGKVMPINGLFIYSTKFPVRQRVVVFRLLAKLLDICYYKLWRARIAPRLHIKLNAFWEKWVRFSPLSF